MRQAGSTATARESTGKRHGYEPPWHLPRARGNRDSQDEVHRARRMHGPDSAGGNGGSVAAAIGGRGGGRGSAWHGRPHERSSFLRGEIAERNPPSHLRRLRGQLHLSRVGR